MEAFEKPSGIERIVNVSRAEEESLLKHFEEALRNQKTDAFEREKNQEEIEVINHVLRCMPEFIRDYGGKPVGNLTTANIHLVDTAKLSEEQEEAIARADVGAVYDLELQAAIVLPQKDSSLVTNQRIVHELLHFNAFTSLAARGKAPPDVSSSFNVKGTELHARRIGFGVFDARQRKRFFRDVDEAIIEELSIRFDARYFDNIPALSDELRRREQMKKRIAEGADEISAVITTRLGEEQWHTSIEKWRYGEQRSKLRTLIKEIYEANQDQFGSEEDVFEVFAKATLTGRLLEVGRLIEETFGNGSFARLGTETDTQQHA
jgi:hypothetical protein